ncbi:MAG: hypothetical protein Q9196_001410 [Gyalolechia fulgens]
MKSSISDSSFSTNVDVSTRLRRAIHLGDLVLVKRIIKNHPEKLQNPDLGDNANTSLHLAAKLGFLEIARFLIDAGHEDDTISRNADGDTPLHLAVETSVTVATLLANQFSRCIPWQNKQGADAVRHTPPPAVMLSARSLPSSLPTPANPGSQQCQQQQQPASASSPPLVLSTLIQHSPVPTSVLLAAADVDGNTALHYASAYGQLKAIRALLVAGADPGARNAYSWTPIAYSSTVQAEVYFRGLVGGGNESGVAGGGMRRDVESGGAGLSRGGVGGAGLRIVRTGEEMGSGIVTRGGNGRRRAESAE